MVVIHSAGQSGVMDNSAPPIDPTGPPPPPPPPPGDSGPRVSRDEVTDLGRLRRSVSDRRIAGVAGGIARHLDIDPILVRVALVVGVFFGGGGLLIYVAAWVLVPEEGTAHEPLGLDARNRKIALIGVGVLALLAVVGDWAGAFWFPWPIVLVALVVLWLLGRGDRDRTDRPSAYGAGPAPSQAGYEAGYQTAYQPGDQTAYQPPATYARPPRPPNPRKRGPILFWFTLALIALAEGVLGVVDLAGTDVVVSAYPALALAITAVMLLVGSFWGRAGGLVLVGLIAAVATAVTTLVSSVGPETTTVYRPTEASQVSSGYDMARGDIVVDLSDVTDVDELDGRELLVEGGAGRLEVILPEGMDVSVDAGVGVGSLSIPSGTGGGFGVERSGFVDGGTDVPDMSIKVQLGVGEIVVREQ